MLSQTLRRCGIVMAAGLASLAATATETAGPDGVPAVWKEQQIRFHVVTHGGTYSCSAIESKLRAMLLELGAAKGLEVAVHSCADGARRGGTSTRFASGQGDAILDRTMTPLVTISIRSLVPDSPAVQAELAANREFEALKALARREGTLDAEYGAIVPAEWKAVRFSDRLRYLDPSDCDLLQQVRAQVFSKLAVRVVRDAGTCQRRSVSLRLGKPNLHVEALVPLARAESPI